MNTLDLRPYAPSWLHRQSVHNRIDWLVVAVWVVAGGISLAFWLPVIWFFKG